MNKAIKIKWLKALRSGEYKQGEGMLRSSNDEFCCLGVFCDVQGRRWRDVGGAFAIGSGDQIDSGGDCNVKLRKDVGPDLPTLINMNDGMHEHHKHSFSEIADYIEANL